MANDPHQSLNSRQDSNRRSKNHGHMTATAFQAVPSAQPRLLQSAQRSNHVPPVLDPELMPATQGLNEWGAFTGGSVASEASGTFGLGPLLFRHVCDDEMKTASTTTTTTTGGTSQPLTSTDLVEMDRLLRKDPVSFNPMRAISWAGLDEDIVEEAPLTPRRENESAGNGKRTVGPSHKGVSKVEYEQGLPRASASDGQAAYNFAMHRRTSLSTSTSKHVDQQPTPSPLGNMTGPFSNTNTTASNDYRVFEPLVPISSLNNTPRVDPFQPEARQQRKHHHRHGKRTGPSPVATCSQIASKYPQSSFPTSSTSVSVSAQPHPAEEQVAYTHSSIDLTANWSFQPPAPTERQDSRLLLCLAPSCQARFPSEAELNMHYQADHAAGRPGHDDRYHPYPSSESLRCSWPLCGAGGFTSKNALVWHVKAEHLLQCPVPGCCNRVFPSWKQVGTHVKNREH